MTESEDRPPYPSEECLGIVGWILLTAAALLFGLCMASPFIADFIRN